MGCQPRSFLCPVRRNDDVDTGRALGVVDAACEFDSGRHRVRHALGGTAERVAHQTRVPVLVVHPEGAAQGEAQIV